MGKCLAAGMDRVVLAATSPEVRDMLAAVIPRQQGAAILTCAGVMAGWPSKAVHGADHVQDHPNARHFVNRH